VLLFVRGKAMPNHETRRAARDVMEIQQEIDRARSLIADSVLVLRERVNEATDWRAWYRRRTAWILGAAFAAGLWLGYRRAPS
jgi:hypothetical protein